MKKIALSVCIAIFLLGVSNVSYGANIRWGENCLDVRGGDTANGTPVQIWDCQPGNQNQAWGLALSHLGWSGGPHGSNGTNKCLDVRGGGTANGTPVQIWDCQVNQNQVWGVRGGHIIWLGSPTGGPYGNTKCLDVRGGGTANGTPVQIWDCQPSNHNQQWVIE